MGGKENQINEIVKYFRMHRGTHALYAFRFFGLEIFNFINCICQIYFIDFFLGGEFASSGTVEKKDGLCVLPVNIINEKTFIFIWFWLVFVAVCTGLFLIFRLSTFLGKQIRVGLITIHGGKSCRRSDVEAILEPNSLSYTEKLGDWFLLHLICKNLNVLLVNDLIRALHKAEEGNNSNTETLPLSKLHSQ